MVWAPALPETSALVRSTSKSRSSVSTAMWRLWLGLVPRQNSSGGKTRLGRISRRGDTDLRRLLITGAQAVLRWPRVVAANPWLRDLLARRPRLVVAVALANKLARIAPRPTAAGRSVETDRPRCGRWAVLRHGTEFRPATA